LNSGPVSALGLCTLGLEYPLVVVLNERVALEESALVQHLFVLGVFLAVDGDELAEGQRARGFEFAALRQTVGEGETSVVEEELCSG